MMYAPILGRRLARLLAAGALALGVAGAARWSARAQPAGQPGSVAAGQAVYEARCAFCHGEALDGQAGGGRTFPALVGPHTVPDYPNAATLYDYIRRSMPYNRPGSLSDEDTLSVVAFLLNQNGLLADDAVLDPAELSSLLLPGAEPLPPPLPGAPTGPQIVTPGSSQGGPVIGTGR